MDQRLVLLKKAREYFINGIKTLNVVIGEISAEDSKIDPEEKELIDLIDSK